jgi:SAM-dependent methyltransferase
MRKEIIREQFNKQAERFAQFELTRNETIFRFIVEFCQFKGSDTLLDVACGSGAFVSFCSTILKHAVGVDISDELIKHAKCNSDIAKLSNTNFFCCDVEKLPFPDASFDVVTCRSAFHHMENRGIVMGEIARTAKKGGKICIQDMISYECSDVNDFFERMEKCIDLSHFRALSKTDIKNLFAAKNIKTERVFETVLTHNLNDYVRHAYQSKSQLDRLSEIVSAGLNFPAISEFLFERDRNIYFKRSGLVIYGKA